VNELPPDAPRLREILAYLDRQLEDHDTVATYLQLQRDAVQAALADTGTAPAPSTPPPRSTPRPATAPPFAPTRSQRKSTGFVVDHQPAAIGPEPARIHVDDCTSVVDPQPISGQDARAALLDPSVTACAMCRPDDELGILDE
jgi:hypothetical protein